MRMTSALVLLVLVSCGPAAHLVTDATFAAVAPEVTRAWAALPPLRNAQTDALEPGEAAGLDKVLSALAPGTPVLVAVLLSSEEKASVARTYPGLRLRFVGPPDQEVPTLSINREEAWAAVARGAAASRGTAWALMPEGTPSAQAERFARAWSEAGGGPLVIRVWPDTGPGPAAAGAVFNWVGPEADSWTAGLAPDRPVHGDPGIKRPPGGAGLSWRIQEQGLGDFLWRIAQTSKKNVEFLPLETVSARR